MKNVIIGKTLKIEDIKVTSFVTSLVKFNSKTIKGGGTELYNCEMITQDTCPVTTPLECDNGTSTVISITRQKTVTQETNTNEC